MRQWRQQSLKEHLARQIEAQPEDGQKSAALQGELRVEPLWTERRLEDLLGEGQA